MRFSENGYYIERYVKCANCGLLIYDEGISAQRNGPSLVFCSDWCVQWSERRQSEEGYFQLKIEQPAVADNDKKPASAMDMVTMNIIDSSMVSLCREMGILLMKTSYSTIFNEGLDFTCALADIKGDMIACAEFCPTMIGGMPLLIKTCAQEIPFDTIDEGDVIVHNDPYRGGLHVPEHTFFKPFFVDGELLGFAVCIGHIAEIGGSVPGAFCGEATEIFHEGLRIPPVKIKKKDVDVDEVWKLMLANVRTPRQNYGDLRAMIGAVDLGVQRAIDLIRKYGRDVFKQACEDLKDYPERRMRAELAIFPDGKYDFEDVIENDGIEDKPYYVRTEIFVQGDEVVADFRRSSRQAKGPINATLGVTIGATYNALLHLTDPSIPKNSGCFRPIRVVSPPTLVTNVDYPGPLVAGNTETHPRLANIVSAPSPPVFPSEPWLRRAARARTSSSAATTRTTTNISPATTSCPVVGEAASATTATTVSSQSTAIAVSTRPKCSKPGFPCGSRTARWCRIRAGPESSAADLGIAAPCSWLSKSPAVNAATTIK